MIPNVKLNLKWRRHGKSWSSSSREKKRMSDCFSPFLLKMIESIMTWHSLFFVFMTAEIDVNRLSNVAWWSVSLVFPLTVSRWMFYLFTFVCCCCCCCTIIFPCCRTSVFRSLSSRREYVNWFWIPTQNPPVGRVSQRQTREIFDNDDNVRQRWHVSTMAAATTRNFSGTRKRIHSRWHFTQRRGGGSCVITLREQTTAHGTRVGCRLLFFVFFFFMSWKFENGAEFRKKIISRSSIHVDWYCSWNGNFSFGFGFHSSSPFFLFTVETKKGMKKTGKWKSDWITFSFLLMGSHTTR